MKNNKYFDTMKEIKISKELIEKTAQKMMDVPLIDISGEKMMAIPVRSFRRRISSSFLKYAAIFLMVLIIGAGSIFFLNPYKTSNNNPASENTSNSGNNRKCVIWWDASQFDKNVLDTAIKDFEEQYPEYGKNILISESLLSMEKNDLEVAIAGKSAPQIVKMNNWYISLLGSEGNVENLLDSRFNFEKHEKEFIPSTWNAVKYKNNAVYGIPFDSNTRAFLVNKDLLKEAGIFSVPGNYEEVLNAGKAIMDLKRENTWGYTLPTLNDRCETSAASLWMTYLWRLGGDLLSADLSKAVFNSPEGVAALDMWINMTKTFSSPMYQEGDFDKGNIGMIDIGSWKIGMVTGDTRVADFQYTMLPVLQKDIPNYSGLGLNALAVVSEKAGNAEVDLSYKFAEFLGTTPEYQVSYCRKHILFPSLIEGSNDSAFNDPVYKVFIDQVKVAKSVPPVECWPDIEMLLNQAIYEACNGEKTAQQALDDAAEKADELLNQSYTISYQK